MVPDLADADQAFILASEAYRLLPWPQGDRPETTLGWFGPHEVNVEYYISWAGDDHILMYSAKKAMRLGLSKAYGDSLPARDPGNPALSGTSGRPRASRRPRSPGDPQEDGVAGRPAFSPETRRESPSAISAKGIAAADDGSERRAPRTGNGVLFLTRASIGALAA